MESYTGEGVVGVPRGCTRPAAGVVVLYLFGGRRVAWINGRGKKPAQESTFPSGGGGRDCRSVPVGVPTTSLQFHPFFNQHCSCFVETRIRY